METPGLINIRWFLSRLLVMSPYEIILRITRYLKILYWRVKKPMLPRRILSKDFSPATYQPDITQFLEGDRNALLQEAESYMAHQWTFLGLNSLLENEINWNRDVVSGVVAPSRFGFSINHRDEATVGNVKNIWEKNRHHHLVILSMACRLTGESRYGEEVMQQIKSWMDQNPYLTGVNWTHPLEQAVRLISWVYCERILRATPIHYELFGKNSPVWSSVYEHQIFITETYSFGSSANNHLIGEMAGLYISAAAWPVFRESGKWKNFSKKILEMEVEKQTFPSGVNKELAFSYHLFVLEFLLLCLVEARNTGDQFSHSFTSAVGRMLQFLFEITTNGIIPRYGDGDEGRAIQLGPAQNNRVEWLLETGKSLLQVEYIPGKIYCFESIWLLATVNDMEDGLPKPGKSKGYPDAGIFIFRKPDINFGSLTMVFDAGPLGYGSMAAHGHADALSFCLFVGKEEVFVDPGTYCYHTDLSNRYYFRGTRAHNTVTINKRDQSVQKGPFLWSGKAETTLEELNLEEGIIKASHNGYSSAGIRHTRRVQFGENIRITDEISGKGMADIDIRFHLSPHARITHSEDLMEIKIGNKHIKLESDPGLPRTILFGEEEGGWYSPSFNVKVPSPTLSFRKTLSLPFRITFLISLNKTDQ